MNKLFSIFLSVLSISAFSDGGPVEPIKPEILKEIVKKSQKKAEQDPAENSYVNSAMVFDWEENALFNVYAAPNFLTHIELEPGETILSKGAGDTQRWIVQETHTGFGFTKTPIVVIKPSKPGLTTNLMISTNRRVYYLQVKSFPETYMATVKWTYPKPLVVENQVDPKRLVAKKAPKSSQSLNFKYAFITKKKPSWMPLRAFDDGKKTYIQMPKSASNQEMPALFALNKKGDREIVNYRMEDNFFVVDRLLDLAELRLGEKMPEVVGVEKIK